MIIEIPIIKQVCRMIISTAVEVVVTFEKNHSTTVTITNPGMTSHFGPYLSNKRPVTGDINPFKIPPGKRTRQMQMQ